MFCKNCGDKLGPADRFCGSCGTPKVELCPTCGQVWEKGETEEVQAPPSKATPKAKSVTEQIVKPIPSPPVVVTPPPAPKIQVDVAPTSHVSSARVQPVYGKQYEAGKDCPNCGEKGQKGKKCTTCKGTF